MKSPLLNRRGLFVCIKVEYKSAFRKGTPATWTCAKVPKYPLINFCDHGIQRRRQEVSKILTAPSRKSVHKYRQKHGWVDRIKPIVNTRLILDVKIRMEISDNIFYFVSGYINYFLKKVDDFYE